MRDFLRSLCKSVPKSKIRDMCDRMEAAPWEREVLLDVFCEPKTKTLDSMNNITKRNFSRRRSDFERRIVAFLMDNPSFLPVGVLNEIRLDNQP